MYIYCSDFSSVNIQMSVEAQAKIKSEDCESTQQERRVQGLLLDAINSLLLWLGPAEPDAVMFILK